MQQPVTLEGVRQQLKKYAITDYNFTDHAKGRCNKREMDPLFVVSHLMRPEKLFSFREKGGKYRLEFDHTPKLSVVIVVRFTDEDLYIITAHKDKRTA